MGKCLLKIGLSAVIWVFILSIEIGGRSLFSYANEYLVDSTLVHSIDDELAKIWDRISKTAETAFSGRSPTEKG